MFFLMICMIILLAIAAVFAREVNQKPKEIASAPQPEPEKKDDPVPFMRKPAMPKVFEEKVEYVVSPLIVKHLDEGRATLMMRHRASKKACTAQLIIWSGRKKRHIRDSYYDLGMRAAEGIGEEIIEAFIAEAQQKIDELKSQGSRKRRKSKEVAETPAAAQAEAPGAVPGAVSVEDNQKPGPAIQKKKFPSVFRGEILEMGFMPRALDDGVKDCYGLRYRTPEGVEDTVWGVNLRTEVHAAHAGIGDQVEILKIGRKTVEEGKAPMNLYKVTKLLPEQIQS